MEPNSKLKRGHVREDGMVFLCYSKRKLKSGEVLWDERWYTREEFDERRRKLIAQSVAYQKRAYERDPEGERAKRAAYFETRREYYRTKSREWQRRNRKKCLKWIAAWREKAILRDPSIRLAHNARCRLYIALKGGKKATNTFAMVGVVNREEYMRKLEPLFQPGMTWDNYGEWEVDHIIPCRYFRPMDAAAQRVCFHYSNLQPMWQSDNTRKRHRVSAACFDRVCAKCPPEHVPYLRELQAKLEAAGKLEKSPYSSPTHVPAS
jgi:hypothetical protein